MQYHYADQHREEPYQFRYYHEFIRRIECKLCSFVTQGTADWYDHYVDEHADWESDVDPISNSDDGI